MGAYLVLIALAVAVNLILTPAYRGGTPDYAAWEIMNWFIAVGTFLVLVVSVMRRHALGGGRATRWPTCWHRQCSTGRSC